MAQSEKSKHIEVIDTVANPDQFNMPYAPVIRVSGGRTVYLAGLTAAPVYHHHPHISEEFDNIPIDAAEQARLTMENLRAVLRGVGGDLSDVVQMFRFIVELEQNQDAINRVLAEYFGNHRAATTTVEVSRLATDPRLKLEIAAIAVVPDRD